jgi:hypothetical protein
MNIKGKRVMVKRLLTIITEIIGNYKKTDPICLTWKNDLTNNLGFLHKKGTVQIRNRKGNQSSNNGEIKGKDKLDLQVEESKIIA